MKKLNNLSISFFQAVLIMLFSCFLQSCSELDKTKKDNINGFYADDGAYEIINYDGRSDVIKVDGAKTSWAVVMYSLAKYKGKMITIELTAEVKREGSAGNLLWQINDGQNYPLITSLNNAVAGVWHQMKGRIVITPSGNDFFVYLTNWENNAENTTYYVYNPTVNIIEGNPLIPDLSLLPLKSVYENHFLMGNIIDTTYLSGKYFDLLKHHFNIVTPGNNLKPDFLAPSTKGDAYQWTTAEEMVNKMISNNIAVHGHVLVWHEQTPSWMTVGTRTEVETTMKNYIAEVLTHFQGRVNSWDVVNEAIKDGLSSSDIASGWKNCVRTSANPWYDALGADYIELAFRAAREADPNINLYYNDYGLENTNKAEAVRIMIKDINDRYKNETSGTRNLIDGVGSQAHVNISLNINNVRESLNKLFSLGIEVSITELDVSTINNYDPGSGRDSVISEANENAQAKVYAELFKLYIENASQITRVTFWGMDDGNSWLSVGNPCLFDWRLTAKRAFFAVSNPDNFLP
ncbi:MAG: endo-1,4-beta-xylanase [Treponema sp.]|jgi:endo-1,4-beta-xylanase|nr:endo-1,4-beta-xylanase [Treponema sp.]